MTLYIYVCMNLLGDAPFVPQLFFFVFYSTHLVGVCVFMCSRHECHCFLCFILTDCRYFDEFPEVPEKGKITRKRTSTVNE